MAKTRLFKAERLRLPRSPGLVQAGAQHRKILDKIKVRERGGNTRQEDIEGRETDILGVSRGRVVDEIAKKLARERGKPVERLADLRLPASRNVRPQTVDGRTSFHFSHEAVSKTRNNMEKDSGLKIGPGAARRHNKYIERDGAIAAMSEKERAELEKLMDGDPELKARLTADGQMTVDERGNAALHGYYVERQEALATQPDGEKVLFTNISADPLERAHVWDKIEEFERNPSPDELIIHVARHQAFWDRVSKEPDFPAPLADALLLAEPDKPYRFQTDEARSSLRWLREQPDWNKDDPAVKEKLGEGGRIQYRMIGELPHELDLRGRSAILAEFAHEFEKRNLPYVAVMHAPDHTNDDRNWHFHLIYYDRPIEKMADGRWDFEVEETYKRPNRMTRSHFPYRQEKVKEVHEKTWIPKMRKRLAEITNDHLQMGGVPRRVDPRRYSEMGIHREPQEHLGTRAAALESMGVATPAGYRNANREWDAVFAEVERRRDRDHKKTDIQAQRYHDRIERNFATDQNDKTALHVRVERWRQKRDEAAEYTSYATSVQKNYERLISRAEKVKRNCDKQIQAAMEGKGSNHKRASTVKLSKRQMEAVREIEDAHKFMGPMLKAAQGWAKQADFLNKQARLEEMELERLLAHRPDATSDHIQSRKAKRQIEENSFQGPDGQYRRALNKVEMDAWVDSIFHERRRLVRRNRRYEPLTIRPGDEKYLNAGNYGIMTPRLEPIKVAQDRLISEVATYIEKNPHAVQRERDQQGDVILSLRVSRPQWRSAFTDYADDPEMKKAALKALEIRDNAKGKITPIERTKTSEPAANQSASPKPSVPTNTVDRLLSLISKDAVRLTKVDGLITADPKALARIGSQAKDLEPTFVQDRLRGIHQQQEREFTRLATFVEKHPYSIVEKNGRFQLGPKSPAELAAIAEKWINDEDLQASLKATREKLRGPSKTSQEKPVEASKSAQDTLVPTQAPIAPVKPSAQPEKPEVKQPVTRAPAEPVRPVSAEQERENVLPPASPAKTPTPQFPPLPSREPAQEEKTPVPSTPEKIEPPARTPEPVRATEPAQANLFGEENIPASGQAVFSKPHPQVEQLRRENAAMNEWMKAGEQEKSLAERRRLAAELAKDKEAITALASTDPELARQLQVDADAFRRSKGMGKRMGRGLTPKR